MQHVTAQRADGRSNTAAVLFYTRTACTYCKHSQVVMEGDRPTLKMRKPGNTTSAAMAGDLVRGAPALQRARDYRELGVDIEWAPLELEWHLLGLAM